MFSSASVAEAGTGLGMPEAGVVGFSSPLPADGLLRATFQLVPGLGPTRERRLWDAGITDWALAPNIPPGLLPDALHTQLLRKLELVETALAARDLPTLARALPTRELWRLYPAFADRAIYLDIETESEAGITAIGLFDHARGPRILLAGRDLASFVAEVPVGTLLVTFNGASFDVPVLRRAFPHWEPPPAHVDLRAVWIRLGQWGGLKHIEEVQGVGRPAHLRGVDGHAAMWMWRQAQHGNREALRRFAEYNLYDAINLRGLLVLAHNRLAAATGLGVPQMAPFSRGDVLYDLSKLLLSL
ncbi:MAG TPA: ribonuclease H-like domain-containing protein [Polyangia bacterium]